jgi:hypothetical protein
LLSVYLKYVFSCPLNVTDVKVLMLTLSLLKLVIDFRCKGILCDGSHVQPLWIFQASWLQFDADSSVNSSVMEPSVMASRSAWIAPMIR